MIDRLVVAEAELHFVGAGAEIAGFIHKAPP
jgi:hypothetical protein